MTHVFISYSRKNSKMMDRIVADLRDKRINVWVDKTGENPGNSTWQDNIEDKIERSACMVVLLSPEAKKSKWVKRELNYAELFSRPIHPVLLSGSQRDAVPIGLMGLNWIDFRENYDKNIMELVNVLSQYPDVILKIDFLSRVFLDARDPKTLSLLWEMLFTPMERAHLENRLLTTKAIMDGKTYKEIQKRLGVSDYVISRAKDMVIGNKRFTDLEDLLKRIPDLKP
jgi:uncharacterized protein YerC